MGRDRSKILKLLETADNFVKYAGEGREERGRTRAAKRYEEAAALARKSGDTELLQRAELRLTDLSRAQSPDVQGPGGSGEVDGEHPVGSGDLLVGAGAGAIQAPLPEHAADRVPPGQRVTRRWPVLHEGPIPKFDRTAWRFTVGGLVGKPLTFGYDELRELAPVQVHSDFHCVTGWSKLDNLWDGIQTKTLLDLAGVKTGAAHVVVGAPFGYTANVPLAALRDEEAILAWGHNDEALVPKHGGPLRLVVPKLYAWKSVKWVNAITLVEMDQRGFWELRGYHNEADPWREERYSYQER
jgi:DMSO/TMAO reductase YedYZ molybdopterin-dependent catalytic subunit